MSNIVPFQKNVRVDRLESSIQIFANVSCCPVATVDIKRLYFLRTISFCALLVLTCSLAISQDEGKEGPQGVVIERIALEVQPVNRFDLDLKLRPEVVLPIVAPTDGIVTDVFIDVGGKTRNQAEVFRLQSEERNLELKKAQAELNAANVAAEIASDAEKKLAAARVEVAKAAFDLAQYRKDQTILRSSIDGRVIAVNVIKGQFVRTGDLLATIIDPNRMLVDLPIERGTVEEGKPIDLVIEDQTTTGNVVTILEPVKEFDPIRELFLSVATARVEIDSTGGKFYAGQLVDSHMVPDHPVAEIPIAALQTETEDPEAERSIQVLREGFVRTLPVQLLGQVGQTHVFVSARFSPNDELIVSSTVELEDGSWVRPMLKEDPSTNPRIPRGSAPRPSGARF